MKKISLLFSSILASSLLMAVPSFADSSEILAEPSQNSVNLIQSSVESNPTSISDLLIMPRAVNGYWNKNCVLHSTENLTTFTITQKSTVTLLVTQKRIGGSAPSNHGIGMDYNLISSNGNSVGHKHVSFDQTNYQLSWTNVMPGTYTVTGSLTGSPNTTSNTTGNVYTTPSN